MSNESLDELGQDLQRHAKHIDFKDMTGTCYREKLIRESFIKSIRLTKSYRDYSSNLHSSTPTEELILYSKRFSSI